MGGGRRDVEADLRHRLARDAQLGEAELRRGSTTTVDAVLDYLISRAYGSADRLLDARDLLGADDEGARVLLLRASRRAADPAPPEPPRPFAAPYAPRPSRLACPNGRHGQSDKPVPVFIMKNRPPPRAG